ncbi:MAG: signal peptidase [Gaiellaceae bacterium]|jgi:signal peptidase I|nr:signal peptidase [Gaiellaceae bacterium]
MMRAVLHPLRRIPQPWRRVVDWGVTLTVAIGFVLAFEAEVAMPFRIPSSSMEGTLHCAKPGYECRGSTDDRVLALRLLYDFESPQRGQIVVFTAPAEAARCAAGDGGSTFVKRIIGLPGETVHEDTHGFISIRQPGGTWSRLTEPKIDPRERAADAEHFNRTWHVPPGSTSWSATTAARRATRAPGAPCHERA